MSDVADRMAPYLGSEYLGLASQEREIRCPSCARQTPIRVVYFADIEQCTAYVEAVRSEWVGRSQCQHCRKCIPIRSPVIVECPTRNLLIFVTHHGDDGEVEKGFKQWLDYVRMVLPRDAFSRVSKRPYAFVHGSVGLLALLSALDGDGFSTSPSPYPHREDDNGIAFGMLVGYSFGRLHFYHPAHRAVQPVVHLLIGLAVQASEEAQREWVLGRLRLAQEVLGAGAKHPWLEEELGRQEFLRGDRAAAREHLEVAKALYHCWLAPTASFMDCTPTRRADGAIHSDTVPSAEPGHLLRRDVTSVRHVVLEKWPHSEDYGVWYFPDMMAQSYLHTHEAVMNMNGAALGSLVSEIGGAGLPQLANQTAWARLNETLEQTLALLRDAEGLVNQFREGFERGVSQDGCRGSASGRRCLAAQWPDLRHLLEQARVRM